MLYRNLKNLGLALIFVCAAQVWAHAQVPTTPKPPQPPPPDTLLVEPATRQAPQIVTIVHRLNGIKALALLRRSGELVLTVDDELLTATNAVTSITAGFALGDGKSIVARLPQAEAELEAQTPPPIAWSYSTTTPTQKALGQAPVAQRAGPAQPAPQAELVVVESSGKQFAAGYVGLDGGSGLSLLRINGLKTTHSRDASEDQLAVGQTVRLFAPVRVARTTSNTAPGTVSLRVGELEARITGITRTSTGRIAYVTLSAPQASPETVGGVALNAAGETIGIVETSEAGKVRLIPAAAVRRAAARVLERQASVPRPWLGVRGESLATLPRETFFAKGWTEVEVAKLKESYKGIVLTSVAPGTPAARADLRPGDVIVRVNNWEVKSPEDFSFFLNEAGSGATVNFTFFRGQTPMPSAPFPPMPPMAMPPPAPTMISPEGFGMLKPLEVSVKMGEALNPVSAMKMAEAYGMSGQTPSPLPIIARGLETVTLSTKAATHLGARRGGLLVVFVDPQSAAARAGLRAFDVIESVNSKFLNQTSWTSAIPAGNPQRLQLGVIRERQKVEIIIQQQEMRKK